MNVLACVTALLLGSTAYNQTFDAATIAYNQGDYAAAVSGYEQLVREGVADPAVFYNLANAYYRQGRVGPAVANYERALQLDPGLSSARRNLDVAIRQTQDKLARPLAPGWHQAWLFWSASLAPKTATRVALGCWWLFFAFLAVLQFKRFPYARATALLLGLAVVLTGLSAWAKNHPPRLAVAVADTVAVRHGASEADTLRFELHEGDRVVVEAAYSDWLRVRTVDGERGWAQANALLLVGPPYPAFDPAAASLTAVSTDG